MIDFSNALAVDGLLSYCGEKKLPVVLCTTGLSEEQLAQVQCVSEKTAVHEIGKYVAGNQYAVKASSGCCQNSCSGKDLILNWWKSTII